MDRILLVEDDRLYLEQFFAMAQNADLAVDTVTSVQQFHSLVSGQSYRLIVIDATVVGADQTLSLLAFLHASHSGSEVIILANSSDTELVPAVLQQGASQCLTRPVHPAILLREVQRCRQHQRLVAENNELSQLVGSLRTGQALSASLDPGEVCHLVMHAMACQAGVARAIGFVRDGDRFEALANQGGDACFVPPFNEQIGLLVLQLIHPDRQVIRLTLPRECQGPSSLGLREALLIPLSLHDTLLGCVVLFNDVGQLLPPSLIDSTITFLQEQGARALENALKFSSTRDMLFIDELSGLFNYRYLKLALEREIKRADRYATQLTVMFLDIDDFKGVNDTYGHLVGSSVLREFGKLLKKSLREVDVLIRYGGDEYTIILVETGPVIGQQVGERLRGQVEKNVFLSSDGYSIRLTVSIGFASYPDDTTGMQELLNMADQAMYAGKTSGKNCVFRVASPLAASGRAS